MTGQIQEKLKEEFRRLKVTCDKMMDERFSEPKHTGEWSDEVFRDYKTSCTRIELLFELSEEES